MTLSLTAGRSEAWVQDRRGHTTSAMLNRYRRAARSAAELGLGSLVSLDDATPELRSPGAIAQTFAHERFTDSSAHKRRKPPNFR